jgi:hypothetical protein
MAVGTGSRLTIEALYEAAPRCSSNLDRISATKFTEAQEQNEWIPQSI